MLTAQQIERLVYILGEDEARTLVYRIILADNEADRGIAEDEAQFWLEEEDEEDEGDAEAEELIEDDVIEFDDVIENDIEIELIPDANGQTQRPIHLNGIDYTLWNSETIYLGGVQVGVVVDGAYIINDNGEWH